MTTKTNTDVEKLEESLNATNKVETLEELEILISKVKKEENLLIGFGSYVILVSRIKGYFRDYIQIVNSEGICRRR